MATIYPDLAGKRAIVTACTAGIGKACVEALVAQGASVALLSRNMDKLHALQETCSHGNKLHMVQMCDMTQPDAVRTAVRTAIAALGGLDVLVINTPGHNEATFAARGHNDTRACAIEHYTINTLASMAAYEAAREAFLANTPTPGGAVVCISSCAAQFCSVQDAQYGYSGAKAALEQWAQGTAVADGPRGIRVNCVRPGVTVTAVWDAARVAMGADPDQILASTAAQTPLQRNATPHDIAAAVVFLCSNSAASFITGTTLSVDGGFSLMHPLCMSYLKPSCGDEEAVDTPQGGGG